MTTYDKKCIFFRNSSHGNSASSPISSEVFLRLNSTKSFLVKFLYASRRFIDCYEIFLLLCIENLNYFSEFTYHENNGYRHKCEQRDPKFKIFKWEEVFWDFSENSSKHKSLIIFFTFKESFPLTCSVIGIWTKANNDPASSMKAKIIPCELFGKFIVTPVDS